MGNQKRILWTLDLLFSRDLVQFMTLRALSISHEEGDAGSPAETPAAMARAAR